MFKDFSEKELQLEKRLEREEKINKPRTDMELYTNICYRDEKLRPIGKILQAMGMKAVHNSIII